MANEYVVVDLETTGLDIANDEIIEVAAVKIRRGLIVDQFSSLVACSRPLKTEIIQLTGITDEMLISQPSLDQVLPMLSQFIGSAELVAHNADFDSKFLQKSWPDERVWLDTLQLAQIVFPEANSYSLVNLAAMLKIDNEQAHRALSDALATAKLFQIIEKELELLPYAAKRDILQLAETDDSPTGKLLKKQCRLDNIAAPVEEKEPYDREAARAARRSIDEDFRLPLNELSAYLGSDSIHQDRITEFEERPQQLQMAQAVAETLNNNSTLLVEAGTGTGKSLAYLLPSALYGTGSGKQIAISTHTRNLQEQLLNKDIPMLSQLLDCEIKACSIKGRSNYLCRRLYKYYLRETPENLRYFLMRIAVWQASAKSRDNGDMNISSFDRWKWQRICAAKENCAPFCPYAKRNSCIVQKVRAEAAKADIIILNHSLLIANAAMESGFLPPISKLIIDEAQHLEHAAEDQLSSKIDIYEILNLLGRLSRREKGKTTGALTSLYKHIEGLEIRTTADMAERIRLQLEEDVEAVIAAAEQFFNLLATNFRSAVEKSNFFPLRVRIEWKHRESADWPLLVQIGEDLACTLDGLARNCFRLLETLLGGEDESEIRPPGCEELFGTGSLARDMAAILRTGLQGEEENFVTWVAFPDDSKRPSLNTAPIEIGELMRDCLYEETESLIMASATLAAGKDFSFFKQRLGLDLLSPKPREVVLESPFHYREQAMFTVVNDLPDWSRCSEMVAIESISNALIPLLTASRGRAIVLFTSHYQLKAVYHTIRQPLKQAGITLLAHGLSGTPSSLLERLKTEEKCCILGANSFWEGIDVIGSALSMIVVVRLPFWPPNSPLSVARMERIEQSGGNPFKDFSLPQALIRFKQGFGRLIRSDKDSGVFCVLDKRILEKYYGRSFIHSVPDMPRFAGTSEEIAERISAWLG